MNCKRELLSRKHLPESYLEVWNIFRKFCIFSMLKQQNYREI